MASAQAPAAAQEVSLVTQDEEEEKDSRVVALKALAMQLGYSVQPIKTWEMELAARISQHMVNREGAFVYQSAAFTIPCFPRETAMRLFPEELISQRAKGVLTWTASSILSLRQLLGPVLTRAPKMIGITKSLRKPSERVMRVVATIIPDVELSWLMVNKREKLAVNFLYVLADEDGEFHAPKDSRRNEISFTNEEVRAYKVAILADILQMSVDDDRQETFPMSPGFWRQLGNEEKAVAVEEMLAAPVPPRAPRVRVPRLQGRQQPMRFDVDAILEVRPAAGRARSWVLVRWEGYDPAWEQWRIRGEVGTPLETWEPICNVQATTAWASWLASKAGEDEEEGDGRQ